MNKQTAVEWLLEQMIQYGLVPKGTHSDNVLFHKAKEMEKEQIIDLIQFLSMNQDFNSYSSVSKETAKYFLEQYYNKTYGQNRD